MLISILTYTANEFGGPKDIRSRMSREIEQDVPGYTINAIGDPYGHPSMRMIHGAPGGTSVDRIIGYLRMLLMQYVPWISQTVGHVVIWMQTMGKNPKELIVSAIQNRTGIRRHWNPRGGISGGK